MADRPTWTVGNRNPSISDTITVDGTAVDISTASALTFKMRPVGSTTLKVNAAATNLDTGPTVRGQWRYDWASGDVDTAGEYLCWVSVTVSGKTEDVGEALIEFRPHGPLTNAYAELEQFKSTAALTGTSFVDAEARRFLISASRAVDDYCTGSSRFRRRFWADADATQVRYYETDDSSLLELDDIVTVTSVAVDLAGGTTYGTSLTAGVDFDAAPYNAAANGKPFDTLRIRRGGSHSFPTDPRSIKVTGKFGWPTVPTPVVDATILQAGRYMARKDAPFGVLGVGGDNPIRIGRLDPDIASLLHGYRRVAVTSVRLG